VDPGRRRFEGKAGKNKYDNKEYPGKGRGVSHVEILESLFIEQKPVKIRRTEGTALGNDKGGGEFLKGVDHLHNQIKKYNGG
jgi:hypothetical protein